MAKESGGTKKGNAKKGGAKKGLAKAASDEVFMGNCLSLRRAGHIVLDATGNEHEIDEKLGNFTTTRERTIFRKDVFDRVHAAGCEIGLTDIPNGADDTLQDVQIAIKEKSRNPAQ